MISLSNNALSQIKELIKKEGEVLSLRVKVIGGGCSGLSYKMEFEKSEPTASDKVFIQDNIKIVMDSKSFLFLKDTLIDYEGGLNGQGFIFKNPNAKKSCGCGTSFNV